MAKMMGPRFKKARRLGLNVYGHPKAMNRAGRGTSREDRKLSDYGKQLLEKQRLATYFGVLEKQFRIYVQKAKRSKEQTNEALVSLLQRRLDHVVYISGLAKTARMARQMVVHGHILVNGKRVDIPSFLVEAGMEITYSESARENKVFTENYQDYLPMKTGYLEKTDDYKVTVTRLPQRDDLPIDINDTLVVEFYSKSM